MSLTTDLVDQWRLEATGKRVDADKLIDEADLLESKAMELSLALDRDSEELEPEAEQSDG